MSFGGGAGDILKVGELAYRVWKACSGASSEFKELDRELSSIQITLRSLADDANDPTSIICRRGAARKDELMLIVGNLELALVSVERLVTKYQSLGLVKKRTFDRARFATHDLNDIRQKLAIHFSALNSFYNSLSTSSLARIETVLEDLYQEIRNGDREPTVISMCNDPEDESAWKLLEKELAFEGIAIDELNRYRSDVVAFLRTLIFKDTEGIDPSDSVSNDPSSSRLAISDLLCLEKLRLHDLYIDHDNPEEDDREAALRWAAENNHLDLVLYLLRHNVNVNCRDQAGATALHGAARMGHVEVANALLDANIDINAQRTYQVLVYKEDRRTYRTWRSNWGGCNAIKQRHFLSAIMEAAHCGKTSIVRLLIEHGASLVAIDDDFVTPLHLAVQGGHMHTACVLIEAGSDLEASFSSSTGRTVLGIAADVGNVKMLKMLLAKGANPLKTSKDEGTILNIALKSKASELSKVRMCHLLVDAGVRTSFAKLQDPQVAPLNIAILQGSEGLVDFLLKRGADPDVLDSSKKPSLYHAIKLGVDHKSSHAIIKRLVQAEADVKWRRTEDDCSLLHIAALIGNHKAVQVLLDNGVNVNDLDRFGTNALHFSAHASSVDCVKILLQKGINATQISKLGEDSYYAHDIAIIEGNAEIIELLARRSTLKIKQRERHDRHTDKAEVWSYDRSSARACTRFARSLEYNILLPKLLACDRPETS